MIKFFRKIRHKLLDENKFSRYLFYAIGEIILVVIGILIALSINNWNEKAKNETILKVYLQNYVEDLRDDKKSMDNLSELNIFRYHALQHLLKLSGVDLYHSESDNIEIRQISNNKRWNGPFPINYNSEFVELAFNCSQYAQSHKLNQSTINELRSTGLFSFIKNQDLKESINNYYEEWNWRMGEYQEQLNWDLIEKWHDALAEEGITTSDQFTINNPLIVLKENPPLIAKLKMLIREAGWISQSAEIVNKNADSLITIIQNELNSN